MGRVDPVAGSAARHLHEHAALPEGLTTVTASNRLDSGPPLRCARTGNPPGPVAVASPGGGEIGPDRPIRAARAARHRGAYTSCVQARRRPEIRHPDASWSEGGRRRNGRLGAPPHPRSPQAPSASATRTTASLRASPDRASPPNSSRVACSHPSVGWTPRSGAAEAATGSTRPMHSPRSHERRASFSDCAGGSCSGSPPPARGSPGSACGWRGSSPFLRSFAARRGG